MINAETPLEQADPNYRGEVAERWRYRDGSGEIGVIASVTQAFCRDCTRAPVHRRQALHLPVRNRRPRPQTAAARRRIRRRNFRRDRRDLAQARRPLFRNPHRADRQARKNRDVVYRRLKGNGLEGNDKNSSFSRSSLVHALTLSSFMDKPYRPQITHASRPLTLPSRRATSAAKCCRPTSRASIR